MCGSSANFVQKDGSSVGYLEVTFAGFGSAGEGTFFVSKQLGIDRPFGNCSAVDRDVVTVFSCTVGVYDLRKELLSYSTFPGHEDRKIRSSHTQGNFQCTIQSAVITYDSKTVV